MFATGCGLKVKRVVDLPIPASQQSFPFPEADTISGAPLQAEVQPFAEPPLQAEPPPGAEQQRPAELKGQSSAVKPDEPSKGR